MWSTLLNHTISIYDGQGNQPSLGHRSILGIPPVSYARSIVGTISCCALKFKPTGGTKDVPRVSRNGLHFWTIPYPSMMVKATNCHLVIDPFLAFHQCLLLVVLSALLLVMYSNTKPTGGTKDVPRVSRNGLHFWTILYLSMMVKGTNRHLVIDPFLAFHQCLLLVLLSALLLVMYSNTEPTGGPKDVATSTTSNPCVWETAWNTWA
jgi:hypothetical protein